MCMKPLAPCFASPVQRYRPLHIQHIVYSIKYTVYNQRCCVFLAILAVILFPRPSPAPHFSTHLSTHVTSPPGTRRWKDHNPGQRVRCQCDGRWITPEGTVRKSLLFKLSLSFLSHSSKISHLKILFSSLPFPSFPSLHIQQEGGDAIWMSVQHALKPGLWRVSGFCLVCVSLASIKMFLSPYWRRGHVSLDCICCVIYAWLYMRRCT